MQGEQESRETTNAVPKRGRGRPKTRVRPWVRLHTRLDAEDMVRLRALRDRWGCRTISETLARAVRGYAKAVEAVG